MPKDRVNLQRDKRKTPIAPRKDKTQKKSTKKPFDPSKFPDWKEETSIPPKTGYIIGGTAPLPASSADTAENSDVTSAGDRPQERTNRKPVDQLSEACRDPGFAAFVNNESDPGAKRWAAFCLSLADADCLSDDRRQSLYRGIRQERRAALLDRLAGAKVPRELAAILIRLSPTELDARAVRQLARDATTPTTLRALAPLDQLTPRLAAQLGLVPERFRTPGLLSILNRLDLSRDFWGKLEANLASIPADLAGSIMGRLRRARSTGGFFDAANAAWEATRRDEPFRLGLGKVSDARLVILDRPSALVAQARRMQNCLADYKFLPRDGDVIYAVWCGSEPATVELVWAGRRWRLGDVRGQKNAVVSPATRAEIETAVHIWGDANGRKPSPGETLGFVRRQARRAAQHFSVTLLEQFRSNLQAIQGKSIIDGGNAFCVFSYGVGYIQFLSDPWGHVFRCEIGSHKYVPEIEGCLTESTFFFLQEAGFEWPKGLANFQRQFFVTIPDRLTLLAQFSVAVLSTIFGLASGDSPEITMQIPSEPPQSDSSGPGLRQRSSDTGRSTRESMKRRKSPGPSTASNSPTGKRRSSPGTLYERSEYEENPDLDPDKVWLDKMGEALEELNAEDQAKGKR